jgi:hypothetical protein
MGGDSQMGTNAPNNMYINEKSKGNALGLIVTIILSAAIAGGGSWYYFNNKFEKEKTVLNQQIEDLNTQIKTLEAAADKKSSASTSTSASSSTKTTTPECSSDLKLADATTGFSFCYPSDWTVTTPTTKSASVTHQVTISTTDGYNFTIYNPVPTMGNEGYNTTSTKSITSSSGLTFNRVYGAADPALNAEKNSLYQAISTNNVTDNANSIIFYGFPTTITNTLAAQLDALIATLGLAA